MKKAGLLLMSLALSTALWAESPEKKGLEVINRSTAEAHIGFLADDDLEGREAGFRGGRIAGDYIVANLKSLGIDPVETLITIRLRLTIWNARREGPAGRCSRIP